MGAVFFAVSGQKSAVICLPLNCVNLWHAQRRTLLDNADLSAFRKWNSVVVVLCERLSGPLTLATAHATAIHDEPAHSSRHGARAPAKFR